MSLARAFTKRVKRSDSTADGFSSIRDKLISSPVALLSTTNMLSYNAPDIIDAHAQTPASDNSASTAPSTPMRGSLDIDSDASTPSTASTDATSLDSSPTTHQSAEQGYFQKNALSPRAHKASEAEDVPVLPKRALSHSKHEHERLARKRSLQFSRPGSEQSIRDPVISRNSIDIIKGNALPTPNEPSTASPFTRELEQLNEVAEEFGAAARDAAVEEDLAVMRTRGLLKFGVDDYLLEIQPLWEVAFDDQWDAVWI